MSRMRSSLPGSGETLKDEDYLPEMVVVPAGSFLMGSPPGEAKRAGNEGPQREVTIHLPFAVGKHVVTFDEFRHFFEETGHPLPDKMLVYDRLMKDRLKWEVREGGSFLNPGFPQTGRHPVVGVSWDDANAYAAWVTRKTGVVYRLPSEIEWEYAARAGTRTAFWWGNDIDPSLANYDGRAAYNGGRQGRFLSQTVAVDDKTFRGNPWSLSHVHGNVREWCHDVDGYAGVRGGSWLSNPWHCRSAWRDTMPPKWHSPDIGFRLVREL
jgi:formylglycine-generating enzyme required for sulfatase activity